MNRLLAFVFGLLVCGAAYAQPPSGILTVPTIANLPSGVSANSNPTVRVLGYYAAGDGGGGTFTLATSSASTDPCMTFSATTGKRYVRQLSNNVLSVLQCGVKADGTTDNSTDLQAAFNAVGTYGIGELYCPAVAGNINFSTTITPVSGSVFRGQANTQNPVVGASGNAAGACHVVYTGSSGYAFDFQTPVGSTCPEIMGPRFYNFTLDQTSTGYGIRVNNPSTAGFVETCSSGSQGQNIVNGVVVDNVVFVGGGRGTTALQLSKAFTTTISNNIFNFYGTQIDIEGSDNVETFNNHLSLALTTAYQAHSHGTFGNFDNLRDNTFLSIYTNASYFVDDSTRSGVKDGNYFETDYTGLTAIFNITCSLAQTITNNAIETSASYLSNWLLVSGNCEELTLKNNYGSNDALTPAAFGSGTYSFMAANFGRARIFGSGNPDNNQGIPYFTQEPQPALGGPPPISGSVLACFSPSSQGYLGGVYGQDVSVTAFSTSSSNSFFWNHRIIRTGYGHSHLIRHSTKPLISGSRPSLVPAAISNSMWPMAYRLPTRRSAMERRPVLGTR